jgi:hypothetical protein
LKDLEAISSMVFIIIFNNLTYNYKIKAIN